MNARLWKVASWLARNRDWFTYDGLRGFHPRWWPEGYVAYPDQGNSVNMALGNAHGYASILKGVVHQPGTGPRDDPEWAARQQALADYKFMSGTQWSQADYVRFLKGPDPR